MKNKSISLLLVLVTLTTFATVNYVISERTIDETYTLKFSTRSTDGTFSGLAGTVNFSPDQLETAFIDISIDANSIKTGNKKKDEHANSPDWLDTKKYPKILFVSKSFKQTDDAVVVTGDLTLHGVTKTVDIPFTFSADSGTFAGSFIVNRSEYGITGAGMKANFVGEEIEVTFNIPTSLKSE